MPDGRADSARLARLVVLAPLRTGLAAVLSALLIAHLAAHARRSATDMGHARTVAAAHCATLMLAGMLLPTLLAGLCVNAIALTAIILLAGSATHRLPIPLTIAARAVLPAIAAAAGMICARSLPIAALRLSIPRLALLGLVATLALAVVLALLRAGLLAILLRLAAIFVAVVIAALAVTVFMVCHLICSSV